MARPGRGELDWDAAVAAMRHAWVVFVLLLLEEVSALPAAAPSAAGDGGSSAPQEPSSSAAWIVTVLVAATLLCLIGPAAEHSLNRAARRGSALGAVALASTFCGQRAQEGAAFDSFGASSCRCRRPWTPRKASACSSWTGGSARGAPHGGLRPFGDSTETVNAAIDADRTLRRFVPPAWDLAGLWRAMEPPEHWLAMPPSSVWPSSLLWGWPKFASLISLAWTAFLRPAELVTASRGHLPAAAPGRDAGSVAHPLPEDPLSRGAGADGALRRGWVVEHLGAVFGEMAKLERLWPASSAAFRQSSDAIGCALGVITATGRGMTPASLRGGGATQCYVLTKDLTRLQHRARWERLGGATNLRAGGLAALAGRRVGAADAACACESVG